LLLLLLLLLLGRGLVHVGRMHHGGRAAPGAAPGAAVYASDLSLRHGGREDYGRRGDREFGTDERE
jgi:hypothetical protein